MSKVTLCASITTTDIAAVKKIEPIVDLFEVRIDLIGDSWTEVARQLKKRGLPVTGWLKRAANGKGTRPGGLSVCCKPVELGAKIVDIEYNAKNVENIIRLI